MLHNLPHARGFLGFKSAFTLVLVLTLAPACKTRTSNIVPQDNIADNVYTAAPSMLPTPGTYNADQSVNLISATAGADIYYTLDGTDPQIVEVQRYTGAIPIQGDHTDVTIRAIAIATGMLASPITTGVYSILYDDNPLPTPLSYTIGGSVVGLNGTLVLKNNDTDLLTIAHDQEFTFDQPVTSGSPYDVMIHQQPVGQTCVVDNRGEGTVESDHVTDILVVCAANNYTLGGTVSGLIDGSVTLQNNSGNSLPVGANGSFSFSTSVSYNSSYNVTVSSSPSGQTCTVTSGATGTIGTANVTNIAVTCSANSYTLGGTLSGLSSGSVTLQNNSGNSLPVGGNGSFSFSTSFPYNSSYTVTVSSSPSGQTCTVTSGATGTMGAANVTNVTVVCAATTYTLGGTVSGLSGTGGTSSITLVNNGGNDLTVTANGAFTFSGAVTINSTYAVQVSIPPTGTTCTVGHSHGTATANVTNITVICTSGARTIFVINPALPNANILGSGSSAMDAADALCQTASVTNGAAMDYSGNNHPPVGTYRALLASDPSGENDDRWGCTEANCSNATGTSQNKNWVLAPSAAYVRPPSSTAIGTTNAFGVFTFPVQAAFSSWAELIFTGLTTGWVISPTETCSNWSSTSGTASLGQPNNGGTDNIRSGNLSCSNLSARIYCVEQ